MRLRLAAFYVINNALLIPTLTHLNIDVSNSFALWVFTFIWHASCFPKTELSFFKFITIKLPLYFSLLMRDRSVRFGVQSYVALFLSPEQRLYKRIIATTM